LTNLITNLTSLVTKLTELTNKLSSPRYNHRIVNLANQVKLLDTSVTIAGMSVEVRTGHLLTACHLLCHVSKTALFRVYCLTWGLSWMENKHCTKVCLSMVCWCRPWAVQLGCKIYNLAKNFTLC